MVDDDVPLRSVGGHLGAWFAKIGNDGSVWGPIVEKAIAKLYGNYARIEFGDTIHGVTVLNGSPYIRHFHKDLNIDQLWELISKFDKEEHRGLIIGNTPGESPDEKNEFGLNQNHSYAVLEVVTLSNGQRLLKVRNPWGYETYTGDYSDSSPLMTEAVREELGHQIGDNGCFYMTMEQFFDQIYYTSINYDTESWHHAYFLALDDDGQGSSRGLFNWCGETCTRYIVTVKNTSTLPNRVHVSANTWHKRSYPQIPECRGVQHQGEMRHSIMPKGGERASSFYSGERWLEPIVL